MITFLIRRIAWGIPVLFTVATVTFILMRAVPGGPFDKDKVLPPEIKANIAAKYHLNEPLWMQYARYMAGLMRGDLGPSYKYLSRSVNDIIADSFPVSLTLGLLALGFSFAVGLPAGIIGAVARSRTSGGAFLFLTTLGISIPSFVLAALAVLGFSIALSLLPPALWEGWRYAVLPVVTLGVIPASYVARYARESCRETLRKEFVLAARAKGLGEGRIILVHVLKNSLTSVVSVSGPLAAGLVSGSFIVEYIFSLPGMGKHFVQAVSNRDYPLIMGTTLVYTVLIIVANILVDAAYGLLDPRVREKNQ